MTADADEVSDGASGAGGAIGAASEHGKGASGGFSQVGGSLWSLAESGVFSRVGSGAWEMTLQAAASDEWLESVEEVKHITRRREESHPLAAVSPSPLSCLTLSRSFALTFTTSISHAHHHPPPTPFAHAALLSSPHPRFPLLLLTPFRSSDTSKSAPPAHASSVATARSVGHTARLTLSSAHSKRPISWSTSRSCSATRQLSAPGRGPRSKCDPMAPR